MTDNYDDNPQDEQLHPIARTGGTADVDVQQLRMDPITTACCEVKKDSSNPLFTTILVAVIALQVTFFAWFFVLDGGCSVSPIPSVQVPTVPPKPKDVLLIQTDDSGTVLRHWEFKETIVENANRGWLFKTDESRVFIAPLKHYIFLENPTPEIKQQFLDGKE